MDLHGVRRPFQLKFDDLHHHCSLHHCHHYFCFLMNQQEMLTQREQLMWDIDGIVEDFFVSTWGDEYGEDMEELIKVLCNAVCKNFPTK